MADRNTLQQMASAAYQTNAPNPINGWTLVSQTPTLKFYRKDYTIVVAIRGTKPTDTQDLQADALIGISSLPTSSRFQNDLNTLRQFQIIYPSPPFQYIGVGHSLGGAILDEFIKSGAISSGLSYNPAIQPSDFQAPINNQRIYMETDPLYQIMGKQARVAEVRKPKGQSIWNRFLKQIPYVGKLYDSYQSHQLDNFIGGTHREDWLRKNKLDPSTRYSLAQLAKTSGIPKATLQEVYNRGIGAYKTQPLSVRMKGSFKKGVDAPMSKKLSKEQWAWGRVYSFLDGNPKHDNDLRKGLKGSGDAYERSASYLREARRRAKEHGYDPSKLQFADNGVHKLQITDPEGRIHRFGRVGYGDHLIWLHREKKGQTPKGTAQKKRDTFQKSHSKIKGDWKSDKYSPNNLALRILW